MKKIHPLPQDVIAKIAAGEVIERPVFAVKELIENAIDAKADYIKIEIEDAGLTKILITDNGEGMSRDDIGECFKPHTTSKIYEEIDLHNVNTLGFRGEALSSICAISNVTIKSKVEKDVAGTLIELKAGNLENISPVGMPVGTSILISNLFYTVPARKNFLKSLRTEYRHILDIVTSFALSYPNIRFLLTHNLKTIFDLPKSQEVRERVKTLLGDGTFNDLIPINYEESYIKLFGFISKPQLATQNLFKNYIFVNKRKVNDRLINLAVKEAYGNLLESNTYPIFILFLQIPYETVDVNVHPRKEQVSFINSRFVFDTVNKAVSETLSKNNLTFYNLTWKSNDFKSNKKITKSFAGKLLKENTDIFDVRQIGEVLNTKEIIQMHNVYLITQTKQGILLVDQHAAHERILYEQFLDSFKKEKHKKEIFILKKSVVLNLSISEGELLKENLKNLKNLGFDIEHFKDNTFKINSAPLIFKDRDLIQLVKEILDDICQDNDFKKIDNQSIKMIEYLACRSAIKAGDKLTKEQCKELIEKLEKTKNNYTCPHGRPTRIEISLNEISHYFKRI